MVNSSLSILINIHNRYCLFRTHITTGSHAVKKKFPDANNNHNYIQIVLPLLSLIY